MVVLLLTIRLIGVVLVSGGDDGSGDGVIASITAVDVVVVVCIYLPYPNEYALFGISR